MQEPKTAPTNDGDPEGGPEEAGRGALLALLRLLTREPPADHDFKTCSICKRYGITEI